MKKRTVLYLQLPRVEPASGDKCENIHMAGLYLGHALEISAESEYHRSVPFIPEEDALDDAHLVKAVCDIAPQVISATLYLWNIERSLDVLKSIKEQSPKTKIVVGGPEVAKYHPFLFRAGFIDAAVSGDGEAVFPDILRAFRQDAKTDLGNVAWNTGKGFVWGRRSPPIYSIDKGLPDPSKCRAYRTDPNGLAIIETVRGCPLGCTFCAYGHGRQRVSYLRREAVIDRIRYFIKSGASQIRFIDPTFNAHPEFSLILEDLAGLNKNKKVKFFAELRPEKITRIDAALLAASNFTEIEIGVQSRNPDILRIIKRPADLERVDKGIRHLMNAGIYLTIDLMIGLPSQTLSDIEAMLDWASGFKRSYIQCLGTLLLPGTSMRREAARFGIRAGDEPPYLVRSTDTLSEQEIVRAEYMIRKKLDIELDSPTQEFVGADLPDLFNEKIICRIPFSGRKFTVKGRTNQRALIFSGSGLCRHCKFISRAVSACIEREPHIMWQFVFESGQEEPLDLFDEVISSITRSEPHLQDRFIRAHSPGKFCSRRIFVKLLKKGKYSSSWRNAVTALLRKNFV